MKNRIYDEKNGLWYELQGDYYIPCLRLPEEKQKPIGIWGQRHLRYIKQYHRIRYSNLLTSGKLNEYLAEIDKQAEDMFYRLVKEMAVFEGITEQLKADDQMPKELKDWFKPFHKTSHIFLTPEIANKFQKYLVLT